LAVTPPDIGAATLVFVGAWNPAILHPRWFASEGLLTDQEVDHVEENAQRGEGILTVTGEVTVFDTEWFLLQATSERLILATSERTSESFLPLRDLALGVLTVLRHTPIQQMGMNYTKHIGLSEGRWERFSDLIAPSTAWSQLLPRATEVTSVQVKTERTAFEAPGFIGITVEPSVRIAGGAYVSVNDHVELPSEPAAGAAAAARVLRDHWEASHEAATQLFQGIKERA